MGSIVTEDSRTADVDALGVLSGLVQQVSDQSPSYSYDAQTYTAKFKGPYSILKDANQMVDHWLSAALVNLPANTSQNFTFPEPPQGTGWWVVGTNVEQTEAGDHGILTIACEARDPSTLGPGSLTTANPYANVWNLRWESYIVKPAAFCSNEPTTEYVYPDTQVQEGTELTGFANREHIDTFMNGNDKGTNEGHHWYRNNTGNAYYLNGPEELILKKSLEDKSALWHYPVLTHRWTEDHYVSNVSSVISNEVEYTEVVGDKIDFIVGGSANPLPRPKGCPYKFPDEPKWIWVKTGDDMQHTKQRSKITFTRTETFMGVLSADVNYYGDVAFNRQNLKGCRWKPGEL